jgi:hypothetical protein
MDWMLRLWLGGSDGLLRPRDALLQELMSHLKNYTIDTYNRVN